MNEARLAQLETTQTIGHLCQWEDTEAELDEMGSFVGSKQQQRWLWDAVDHETGEVLAYGLAEHKDAAFRDPKALLPFGITQFYTDSWGAMSGISNLCFIQWVKRILKRLSASI